MIKKISRINEYIENDNTDSLIISAENFHNNQYTEIINTLITERKKTRLVCIAGPSSSGKTIFSNKLRQKLLDIGVESFVVSMDNYFMDKESISMNENGEYDFESIDIIEVDLFDRQMERLIAGECVRMPEYSFFTGKKEYSKATIQVKKSSLIFVEGIHALNYKVLFPHVDRNKIFGIYITPQDVYESDDGDIIEPHQVRLIRRIVRDTWYRNCNITGTLKMWDSVRAGEFKYIFPNKDNADYNFNSSIKYELPIMKKFYSEEYSKISGEEQEICDKYINKKTLEKFADIGADAIPQASILNEFIPKIY